VNDSDCALKGSSELNTGRPATNRRTKYSRTVAQCRLATGRLRREQWQEVRRRNTRRRHIDQNNAVYVGGDKAIVMVAQCEIGLAFTGQPGSLTLRERLERDSDPELPRAYHYMSNSEIEERSIYELDIL